MAKSKMEYELAGDAIERWVEAVSLGDIDEADLDDKAEALGKLNRLAWTGTTDFELDEAVVEARESGCDWAPIGLALGIPRQRARQKFGK